MPRIDLHTHSIASPDGGLSAKDYESTLRSGRLDVVAITDHDRIDFAKMLHEVLGDAVIVGEEISTLDGDIIGLFLHDAIPAGKSIEETVAVIHEQGGIVYIPHPFETVRKGITLDALNRIANEADIVETYNGRTLQNRGSLAKKWAEDHDVVCASSSDAHGSHGWGKTASIVTEKPTQKTLLSLLASAEYHTSSTGFAGKMYPKLNRLRKRSGRA